jgi:hypothetical protein
LAYGIKAWRRLAPLLRRGRAYPRLAYVALLDRLSDLGRQRQRGETRERHAARLAPLAPHLAPLTRAHLARALGGSAGADPVDFRELVARVDRDLKHNLHPLRRALGVLNPIGWMFTR